MKIKTVITVLLFSLILASCAPAAIVAPTETASPTATSTPLPTSTPTPIPSPSPTPIPTIEVEGYTIPDPRFSNPELFDLEKANAPIALFVDALKVAGINATPQTVSDNLIYKVVKAQNGDMAVLLLTSDLSETAYDEGNIPLFIYSKDPQDSKYRWGVAHLKDLAGLHDILMGVVLDGFERLNDIDPRLFDKNYNMVTMTWSSEQPFAQMSNGQTPRLNRVAKKDLEEIMWFHLGDIPLETMTFSSKDEAVQYVNSEVDRITQKYKDKMTIVNVFNEIHPYSETHRNRVWKLWKQFGDKFLIDVYQHVRATLLPGTKIIYNNSDNYTKSHEGTYYYTVDVVNALKGHIDAVGMEMHMAQSQSSAPPPGVDEMADIMRSFGIPVYVTELDVNQTYLPGSQEEKNIQQADIYEMVVRSCVKSEVCEMINFWSSTNNSSWYDFAVGEPNANAGIFENNGTPKLAYYAVLRGLTEGFISSVP